MKKRFIFLIFLLLYPSITFGQTTTVKLNLIEDNKDNFMEKSISEKASDLFEYSKQLNNHLTADKINDPFSQNIQANFNVTSSQARNLEAIVRAGIKTYRFGIEKYNEIKQKILAPQIPPRTITQEEFDKINKLPTYKPSDDLLVTNNFLRTIPYSQDPAHFRVIKKKLDQDIQNKEPTTQLEALQQQMANINLKSWLGFGQKKQKPKAQKMGYGTWQVTPNISARIISTKTRIGNNNIIIAAIHFNVKKDYGIKYKPTITFNNSTNIKSAEAIYPVPQIYINENQENEAYYFGDFAIPLIAYPVDGLKNININTQINLELCTQTQCSNQTLNPSLELKAGLGINTLINQFIYSAHNNAPKFNEDNSLIKKIYINNNQELVVAINDDYKPKKTYVYIENIKTYTPSIKITNFGFEATFKPVNKIEAKEARVIISLNSKTPKTYQKTIEKQSKNTFKFFKDLVHGFLFNLYPWMLAIFSLMLSSLSASKTKSKTQIKQFALISLTGISIMAISSYILPYWGWQLEKSAYLITMIFVFTGLIALQNKWIQTKSKIVFAILITTTLGLATNDVLFNNPNWFAIIIGFMAPFIILYKYPIKLKTNKTIITSLNFLLILSLLWLIISTQSFLMLFLTLVVLAIIWLYKQTKNQVKKNSDAVLFLQACTMILILIFFIISIIFVKSPTKISSQPIIEQNAIIISQPNWCLSCKLTNFVLNPKLNSSTNKLQVIKLPYDENTINYFKKFNIYKPPFYMLYTPNNKKGIILPRSLFERDVNKYVI